MNFVSGADLVIYDGMFTEEEYDHYRGWGHSTWNAGVALCREAGAKSLALFHHHPRRTDVDLDLIEAELALALPGSFCAREQHSTTYATDAHVGMIEVPEPRSPRARHARPRNRAHSPKSRRPPLVKRGFWVWNAARGGSPAALEPGPC